MLFVLIESRLDIREKLFGFNKVTTVNQASQFRTVTQRKYFGA